MLLWGNQEDLEIGLGHMETLIKEKAVVKCILGSDKGENKALETV